MTCLPVRIAPAPTLTLYIANQGSVNFPSPGGRVPGLRHDTPESGPLFSALPALQTNHRFEIIEALAAVIPVVKPAQENAIQH